MNRLRQTEQLQSGQMSGVAMGNYPWISPQEWRNPFPIVRGTIQVVYDQFEKWPWNPYWRYRQMLPLNDVLMSKIEFVTPKQKQNVYYRNFSQTFNLYGDNVAAIAHTAAGWGNAPPTDAYHVPFTSVQSDVAQYLLQRCYSKASSAEYDFGVPVAELAETASMLAGPLRGIVKLSGAAFAGFSAVRRDGLRVVARVAKNATTRQLRTIKATTSQHPLDKSLRILDESANHWLAYKFGVCPLIEDTHKAIEFAKENVDPHLGLRVARAEGWKSDETVRRPSYNFNLCLGTIGFSAFGTVRTIDRHTSGLYWRNKITAPLVNFLENIGFSPFQLPSLAYELIPLSFVVDRFVDIKSFVRGNIGSLSKETYGCFTTRKIETIWTCSLNPVVPSDATCRVSTFPTSHVRMLQMARSTTIDRPNFPVINPYWRQQLVADATNLSLIWGRLRTFVGKN